MKTPEELAEQYVRDYHRSEIKCLYVKEGYLAGYAAANRWIPVEEELPPEDTCESENTILVIYFNSIEIGKIEYTSTDPGQFHFTSMSGDYIDRADKVITDWMPLPPLPNKE